MDIVTREVRSRMMAGIRGRDTKPEIIVRRSAHAMGFRYRLHQKDLPGCPDLVFPRLKLAVFVHGCFWHAHQGCPKAKIPASNTVFWTTKLLGNRERDQRTRAALEAAGWRVETIWECEVMKAAGVETRLRQILVP
jgi:DNA mismatch endonuclease (patch repair protein)